MRKAGRRLALTSGQGLSPTRRPPPGATARGAPRANFKEVALARLSGAALVDKLGDANGWVRDTAQRLLVEKRDPASALKLRAVALDAERPPLARLHALWTLDGFGGDVLLDGGEVQRRELRAVVEVVVHRIGRGRVLRQHRKSELLRPPVGIAARARPLACSTRDRALHFG